MNFKLTEKVPEDLLKDDSITVYFDGEDVISQFSVATQLYNPFDFDASRFLPNVEPMDLQKFFSVTREPYYAQKREGIVADKQIQLTEEYPPEPFHDIGDELIAYRVLRREPAKMNTKGTSVHIEKVLYYDGYSNHPNKAVVVESRPVDHIIEFTCWGKTNKLANARALC